MGLLVRTNIKVTWLLLLHLSYNYGMTSYTSAALGELELEDELKILNKPPIKTIKGKAGDLFDCVDIHNQPAFDNPSLQKHKIQMKPSFVPKDLFPKSKSAARHQLSNATLKDGGCPEGTVPIKRTTKEDLFRAKAFYDLHGSSIYPLNSSNGPTVHMASARTKDDIHYGVQGVINIQNPKLTSNDSTSGAFIFVLDDPNRETIGAGWMVAPSLYGDTQTRLTIFWNSGNVGCYNLLCSGFVQVDPSVPIGLVLKVSEYGGFLSEMQPFIFKDPLSLNWWLVLGNDFKLRCGYWPSSVFTSLNKGGAPVVGWLGGVSSPVNQLSPQMGSGTFPDGNFGHSCYFLNMRVCDSHLKLSNVGNALYETDRPTCYGVLNYGYLPKMGGYAMMFGGPGGKCD